MRQLVILLYCWFIAAYLFAPALGQEANIIVLNDSSVVKVKSQSYYTYYRETEMLLKNNDADYMGNICLMMGPGTELQRYEYEIRDLNGQVLRTLKQRDLERTEYTQHLACDDYMLIGKAMPPTYPVIVKRTIKMSMRNNILEYPEFVPQPRTGIEVKHATYSISWSPKSTPIHYKTQLLSDSISTMNGEERTLSYRVDNLKPEGKIPYASLLDVRTPKASFAPDKIDYYGTTGSMTSWSLLGAWNYGLCDINQTLPESLINTIRESTKESQTDFEKVSLAYDLLRQQTRYVSLQLGIGGYRPAPANEVYARGYGDCKGLSNYMQTLLKTMGIESRLVLISTDSPKVAKDYPELCFNHMILEVFLEHPVRDTLWVECTSRTLPLGYLHSGIAGHDALELTADGGRLVTLPKYIDAKNLKRTTVRLTLQADASADVAIESRNYGSHYANYHSLLQMKEQDYRNRLSEQYTLPTAEIGEVRLKDLSSFGDSACLNTYLQAHCRKYANRAGSRLFVPANPLHQGFAPINAGQGADMPLVIAQGFCNEEIIDIELPENAEIESLPADAEWSEDCALFRQKMTTEERHLRITLTYNLKSGTYPAEQRQKLAALQRQMAKLYSAKLIVKLL